MAVVAESQSCFLLATVVAGEEEAVSKDQDSLLLVSFLRLSSLALFVRRVQMTFPA